MSTLRGFILCFPQARQKSVRPLVVKLNFCSECWSVFLRWKLKLPRPSSTAQDLGTLFHHSFSKLLFKARDAKTSRQHHFNSELPLLILQRSERLPHYPVRGNRLHHFGISVACTSPLYEALLPRLWHLILIYSNFGTTNKNLCGISLLSKVKLLLWL